MGPSHLARSSLLALVLASAAGCGGGSSPGDAGSADAAGALCDPCRHDSECAGEGTWCVPLATGGACGRACAATPCPTGFTCTIVRRAGETSSQCVPDEGACLGCLDSDGDGVCNASDLCPGHDDAVDADADGRPDGCDACPADAPPEDSDGDGVCESDDACPGLDDRDDLDADGTPDGCDRCPARIDSVVFADPGFSDPGAWTASERASVDPAAAGRTAPGAGIVTFDDFCLGGDGSFAADGCAPTGSGGPLRMRVATSWQCDGPCEAPDVSLSSQLDIRNFAGSALEAGADGWVDLSVCLGEAVGLGPVSAVIEADSRTFGDPPCSISAAFDDLVIEDAPPGACPSVGTVLNGDFEGATGWSRMSAVVVDGTNRAAHLHDAAGCPSGEFSITGLVSIPLPATMPHPALSLRTRGALPQGGGLHADVSWAGGTTRILTASSLTASWSTQRVCLPAAAAGSAAQLSVQFNNNDCGRTLPLDAWLDDLVLVSDPALCP